MADCFIMFAFSHYGEPRECPTQYASPPTVYSVLPASTFTPEDVKNIYEQREYGINPGLLTDHTALQGENRKL